MLGTILIIAEMEDVVEFLLAYYPGLIGLAALVAITIAFSVVEHLKKRQKAKKAKEIDIPTVLAGLEEDLKWLKTRQAEVHVEIEKHAVATRRLQGSVAGRGVRNVGERNPLSNEICNASRQREIVINLETISLLDARLATLDTSIASVKQLKVSIKALEDQTHKFSFMEEGAADLREDIAQAVEKVRKVHETARKTVEDTEFNLRFGNSQDEAKIKESMERFAKNGILDKVMSGRDPEPEPEPTPKPEGRGQITTKSERVAIARPPENGNGHGRHHSKPETTVASKPEPLKTEDPMVE